MTHFWYQNLYMFEKKVGDEAVDRNKQLDNQKYSIDIIILH